MTSKATPLIAALALVGAAFSTAAALQPEAREEDDKIVLANDHVRVWFQGKKPMLKVFPANATGDDDSRAFGYQFRALVEYNDLDGDGAPSEQEVVARLDLNKANQWNVTREDGEGNVTLTLSLAAPVKLGRDVEIPVDNLTLPGEDRTAKVALVFRIFEGAETIETPEGNVTVPATAIKYDLVVDAWPFVNADVDRLALILDVAGDLDVEGQNATVLANGTEVGALTWVTTATGNTTEGDAIDVPVRVSAANESEGKTRLAFTYDAPGLASFVHDPTVGTATTGDAMEPSESGSGDGSANDVPAPGVALLAAVAVGAALLSRRRRDA